MNQMCTERPTVLLHLTSYLCELLPSFLYIDVCVLTKLQVSKLSGELMYKDTQILVGFMWKVNVAKKIQAMT